MKICEGLELDPGAFHEQVNSLRHVRLTEASIDKKDKEAVDQVKKALKAAESVYSKHFDAEVKVGSGFSNFDVSRKGGHTWLKAYLVNKETEMLYWFLIDIDMGKIRAIYPEIRRGRDTMETGRKVMTKYSHEEIPADKLKDPLSLFGPAPK